jgi:hypothetical protein
MHGKSTPDELKLLYEQNNNQFRFFLTWRQLLLAGFFAVFGAIALAFRWSLQHNPSEAPIIPFVGSVVSVLLWLLDYRNYQLIEIAAKASTAIEKQISDPSLGYFATFEIETARYPGLVKKWIKHRVILNIIYFGAAALMLAAGILCLVLGYNISPDNS